MKVYKVTIENKSGMVGVHYYTKLKEIDYHGLPVYEGIRFDLTSMTEIYDSFFLAKECVKKIEEIEIDTPNEEKENTEVNEEERWALCDNCVEAIRSHGEKILTRPMEREDFTEEENETDAVVCDWCEEEYCISDMNICQ